MGRASNWTSKEDEALAKAWIKASADPVHGNYQKTKNFWGTIQEYYTAFTANLTKVDGKTKLDERSISSMQTRWNQINKATLKFNGIFTQVVKVIKSGWNQEMYEEEAKRLYLDEVKEPFNFYNIWSFVKDQPKWQSGGGSYKKLVVLEDLASEMLTEKKSDEKSGGTDSNGENKENKSADRPIGNKAAKQARAEENKKTSFEEMNATSMRIRALAHRDAIAFNIMKQVPDCDASKEWFTMKAEEFVRELKEEAEKKRKEAESQQKRRVFEEANKKNAKKKLEFSTPVSYSGKCNGEEALEAIPNEAVEVTSPSIEEGSNNHDDAAPAVDSNDKQLIITTPIGACCAGDYCFWGPVKKPLANECNVCKKKCHTECSDEVDDGEIVCSLCWKTYEA
jgi:hypothetical protein